MYAIASSNAISYFLRRAVGLRSVFQVTDLRKRWFCAAADHVQQNGTLYSSYLKHYFPSPGTSFDTFSDGYYEKGFDIDLDGHKETSFEIDMDGFNSTLTETNPTYPVGMKECLRIVKGERLEEDVLTLLSNRGMRDYLVRSNGDKVAVDSLAGKYVLICCFKLPFSRTSYPAYACRSMISAYSQLVKNDNENFEMVMVAKIAPLMAAEEEEGAFNHFFQAFPCLAIPFWDTESRDFLCKSLGLTRRNKHFAALVLDPNQMVLQTEDSRFYNFGASGFPYDDERLDALDGEDKEIRCRLDYFHRFRYCKGETVICKPGPVSLVELLGGYDLLLSRFGGGDEIRVSELSKKKCVVFYLCVTASHTSKIEMLREKCVAENREFEVVVVQIPFYSNATSYVEAFQATLKWCKLSSWWVMPVNDDGEAAARRLWRLCGLCASLEEEQWIFVADGGNSGELEGRQMMDRLSDWEILYPYTRKSMLDQIFCRIRSLTLDSLLGYHNQLIQLSSDSDSVSITRTVNVSELKGKNVVLYLGSYEAIIKRRHNHYKLFLWLYQQMQKDCPNSEAVFFPLDKRNPKHSRCPPMPCLVLPRPAAVARGSVIRKLFPDKVKEQGIFAFGDDGHVRSIDVIHKLDGGNVSNNLFSDTLFEEVSHLLENYRLERWRSRGL